MIDDTKEIQLESQISRYFMKDNGVTCHFRYVNVEENKVDLYVYTFNKDTQVNFLFHKVTAVTEITGLTKMLNYLKEVMPEQNNYTVVWKLNDNEKMNESYFRGSDIEEVVNKFYVGKKDRESILVTDVTLNPLS
jgi:hypothetical protein